MFGIITIMVINNAWSDYSGDVDWTVWLIVADVCYSFANNSTSDIFMSTESTLATL